MRFSKAKLRISQSLHHVARCACLRSCHNKCFLTMTKCMLSLSCFMPPARSGEGHIILPLYVRESVRPSHFYSTVLVSATPPTVFEARSETCNTVSTCTEHVNMGNIILFHFYCRITAPWIIYIFWPYFHALYMAVLLYDSVLISTTPTIFEAVLWNLQHS